MHELTLSEANRLSIYFDPVKERLEQSGFSIARTDLPTLEIVLNPPFDPEAVKACLGCPALMVKILEIRPTGVIRFRPLHPGEDIDSEI